MVRMPLASRRRQGSSICSHSVGGSGTSASVSSALAALGGGELLVSDKIAINIEIEAAKQA